MPVPPIPPQTLSAANFLPPGASTPEVPQDVTWGGVKQEINELPSNVWEAMEDYSPGYQLLQGIGGLWQTIHDPVDPDRRPTPEEERERQKGQQPAPPVQRPRTPETEQELEKLRERMRQTRNIAGVEAPDVDEWELQPPMPPLVTPIYEPEAYIEFYPAEEDENITYNTPYPDKNVINSTYENPIPEEVHYSDNIMLSRAKEGDKPAAMSIDNRNIKDVISNRRVNNQVFMRLPINDFINLTTRWGKVNKGYTDKIISIYDDPFNTSNIEPYDEVTANHFLPEEVDRRDRNAIPTLEVDKYGQILSHEGRHRAAALLKDGAETIPVMVTLRGLDEDGYDKHFKSRDDVEIPNFLHNQINTGFVIDMPKFEVATEDNFDAINNLVGEESIKNKK